MTDQATHPSPQELSAFSMGQLPDDIALEVESHVADCESCCETLLGLSDDDTFVGLLKQADQLDADQTVDRDPLTSGIDASISVVPEAFGEHGRYEINRLIGRGGMGDVYQARHRKMDRMVALKVINRDFVRKAEAVDRFHREVQAAAKLAHPNIVTAYDADQAGEFHYLAMEYVDGVNLAQLVKEDGPLSIETACEYIEQAAIGLQYAHQRGMVHRDIKPHNLMVTADGTVKILDFGLASLNQKVTAELEATDGISDLTSDGAILGTPDYISPEQAVDARQADIRSDIYGLGATLYFLLSGRPPFAEGNVLEKLKCLADDEPEPISSLREGVPPTVAAIASRLLAKDPDERYQTPAEVAQALKSLSVDDPSAESHETTLESKPARQKPRFHLPTAIAALFFGLLCATVFYLQTNHGTVRVKVTDPTLAVRFNDQSIGVEDKDKKFTIRAGESRKLFVTQQGSDVELVTEKFLIRRNEDIVFEVSLVEGELKVAKDGEDFGMKTMPPLSESPERTAEQRVTDAQVAKAKEILGFEGEVTPETIIAALDAGLFAYPLVDDQPEATQPSSWGGRIRLRTAVRGEGEQGMLYSPVLDLLLAVAKPQDAVTEESILKLDKKLVELSNKEERYRYRIEAGVAAIVFAFERGDVKSGMKRLSDLKFYGDYYRSRRTPFDLNLWLAVREALDIEPLVEQEVSFRQQPEETIAIAKRLSEYAIRAAGKSDDPRVEQALLRERDKLLQKDRLELAKAAFARGDRDEAKEILRTVPGVGSAGPFILYSLPRFDSDAAVAFKLAELLVEESDWNNAADAYLEAYRGEIRLLSTSHVDTFKKCNRTTEFVQTLIEEHVVRVDAGYLPINVVELLLKDEKTRADGDQLLKHLWASPRSILIGRLLGQKDIWKQVPDLSYYLKERVLPANFETAGAGWTLFEVRATNEYSADKAADGFPVGYEPLLQDKAALRKLSKEVAAAIEQHPDWKAGTALLAFLEAEVGNYERATELVRQVLSDAETLPVPSDSAWLLGLALEGRDDKLDREVMRLYESSLRSRPERVSRVSAIPSLARLHAKFDQRPEARQFLHRMTTINYDPRRGSPICVYGRSVNRNRCTDCHSGKSNLLDICLMSDQLNDIGYPIDSLIALGRIDRSFGNAYGSDDAWTKQRIPEDFYSGIAEGRSKFVPLKNEALEATTPQAVLEALKSGVFSNRDMTKPVPENAEVAIVLTTSVRGVDGKSVLFSPELEVLERAAKAEGDEAAIAILQIDQLLVEAFDATPDDLEAGIAAAAFAFMRNDLEEAENRSQRLIKLAAERDVQKSDLGYWFVARLALAKPSTKEIGKKLANRALAAAAMQVDQLWKEAIQQEKDNLKSASETLSDKTKPNVQLHFLEPQHMEGVTERTGIPYGEGDGQPYVYIHSKPALVLEPKQVVSVAKHDYEFSGKQIYAFDVHLTKEARNKIAKVVEGQGKHMRHVTFVVDGVRCGGMQRYEVDLENPRGIPEACRATSYYAMFTGSTDKELVQRIIRVLEGYEAPVTTEDNGPAKPPVIELKWAVSEHIPGFTHDKNYEDYLGNTYYSSKPVLTLTPENVASAKHSSGSPPPSGGILFHHVHVSLTNEAHAEVDRQVRQILQDESKRKKVKYLTLLVDGQEGFSATLRPGQTGSIGWNTPSWRSPDKALRVLNSLTAETQEAQQQPAVDSRETSRTTTEAQALTVDEEEELRQQRMIRFFWEQRPDIRNSIAEDRIEEGDEEGAKRVLNNVRQVDPKAKALLELAKIYQKKGSVVQATDAYLAAYRLQPDLLSDDHMETIIKAERTGEFVDVFTVENLRKLGYVEPSAPITRRLLLNEATRQDGVKFLERVWIALPDTQNILIMDGPDNLWDLIPDTVPLIRARVLPGNIPAEGAGWDRFAVDVTNGRNSGGYSKRLLMKPLFRDKQKIKLSLPKLAEEVENAIKQNPPWKAGVALLGYLEAELGNDDRSVELFEQVLSDKQDPIPYRSAWAFGFAIEGKSETLDRIAIKLYERSLKNRDAYKEHLTLRSSPLPDLAVLYAKYDRRDEARQLLAQLAEPPINRWAICSPARDPRNALRCMECHQKEQNLFDFTVMSNTLTDIGYPVDALTALYRIDASFHNAYSSDEEWVETITPDSLPHAFRWNYAGRENFKPIKRKAEAAITPQMVLESLKAGAFGGDGEDDRLIELQVGVRGEDGKSTLFSPVIDILGLAAKAKGDQAASANKQIDQLLAEAFEKNPADLELGIAATVFAFLQKDENSAADRLKKLLAIAEHSKSNSAAFWLVARHAMEDEQTRVIGDTLAERALAAADQQPDSELKEAILSERAGIGAK